MKQVIIIVMAIVMISCSQKNTKTSNSNIHEINVVEVIQTSEYTYVRFTENEKEQWLATPTIDAQLGEKYYYEKSMEMKNFHSKELGRDFESILFIDKLSTEPTSTEKQNPSTPPGSAKAKGEKMNIQIEKAKDGITVAELFSNKGSYNNKTVVIKGQVVKYSPGIMKKNWLHIQDGTESNGKYDLTVTTLAELKVGDVVTLEGKISLDKDFGYGYVYEVLLEDAVIK